LVQKITAVLSDLIRARGAEADAILETAEAILKKAVDKVESQVGHLKVGSIPSVDDQFENHEKSIFTFRAFHASNLNRATLPNLLLR